MDWSSEAFAAHVEALRVADERFLEERDRRYHEIACAREKALENKEAADQVALGLARQLQTVKDEKALADLHGAIVEVKSLLKPLAEYVAAQQGRSLGVSAIVGYLVVAMSLALTIIGLVVTR